MPTLAPIKIVIAGIDNFSKKFGSSIKSVKAVGDNATRAGRKLTAGLTIPLALAGVGILGTAASFQEGTNRIEALTQAPVAALTEMTDLAKSLGKETRFSAREAADAMGFLGMAGWKTNAILEGTPHILDLAAASGTDLARSADIVSNIMGGFELATSKTGYAVDVLAAGSTSANVTVEMLSETMSDAAPIAKQFGSSLLDAVTIAGFLGNIGIQGSKSATSMKNIFTILASPEPKAMKWFKYLKVDLVDINKNTRPVANVFKDLGLAISAFPNSQRLRIIKDIFGKIPIAAAASLSSDLGKTDSQFMKLVKTMESFDGRAKKMAVTMNKGFTGELYRAKSALEGLAIELGETGFLTSMTKLVSSFAGFISTLANLNPAVLKMAIGIGATIAIIGPALLVVGKLVTLFVSLTGSIAAAGGIIALISNPISLAIGLITLLATVIGTLIATFETNGLSAIILSIFAVVNPLIGVPLLLMAKWRYIVPYFKLVWMGVSKIFSSIKSGPIGSVIIWLSDVLTSIGNLLNTVVNGLLSLGPKLLSVFISDETLQEAGFTNEMLGIENESPAVNALSTLGEIKKQKVKIEFFNPPPGTTATMTTDNMEAEIDNGSMLVGAM